MTGHIHWWIYFYLSNWWADFSVQTPGRALQPAVYVYLQTQWSCVCPLLGLDLPWRGWSSPSYRRSPGRPAVSAHFTEHNGAPCTDAYPDGIIHLQQDHSSIHYSRVVQEWLSRQADVELLDWPPRAPEMNPIENMWSEVNRTMQETWPVLPPRNSDELWALVLDAWH